MYLKGGEGGMQRIYSNEELKGQGGNSFLEARFLWVNLRRWGTKGTFEYQKEVLYPVGHGEPLKNSE